MTDIIVKDIKNGSEYYYGWGAEVSAEETTYDNTTSGLTATTVQDAIDEVNSKSEQIVTLNWDIIIAPINQNFDTLTRYKYICAATSVYPVLRSNHTSWGQDMCIATTTGSALKTYDKNGTSWKCIWIDDKVYIYDGTTARVVDLNTLTATTVSITASNFKTDGEYIYWRSGSSSYTYKKCSWANPTVEETSTATEYNAIPDGIYYKWYYYSTSGKNIVVKDSTWATVQTIENFGNGEILQIFNGKIYKAVDWICYALAKTL